jgi:hypothetical protein
MCAFEHQVDLVALESGYAYDNEPIYTRALLRYMKIWTDHITRDLRVPIADRRLQQVAFPGTNGKVYDVWDWENCRANSLRVHYLARVEMHPDFQRDFGEHTDQIKLLRRYNKDCENECIDAPFAFETYTRKFKNEHLDEKKLADYHKAIFHTKALWQKNSSREMLIETFQQFAKSSAPITQIVCFGLGALDLRKSFYHSLVQYMAIFTISRALEKFYRQTDSTRAPIKLVLQDPNYEFKDHFILRKLFNEDDNISFVDDPDGLLAIDAGSLVVTSFLPVQMPLVQIIADMFHGDPTQGPVAIICDTMEVNPDKGLYSLEDRASPATARFFTDHYDKFASDFLYHGLDEEFMAGVYGDDWKKLDRYYWLNYMDMRVRK